MEFLLFMPELCLKTNIKFPSLPPDIFRNCSLLPIAASLQIIFSIIFPNMIRNVDIFRYLKGKIKNSSFPYFSWIGGMIRRYFEYKILQEYLLLAYPFGYLKIFIIIRLTKYLM